eukprot:12814112-Prorocentrum_lima.AAC.1
MTAVIPLMVEGLVQAALAGVAKGGAGRHQAAAATASALRTGAALILELTSFPDAARAQVLAGWGTAC